LLKKIDLVFLNYTQATNGTEWYSTWNNGHDRMLEFGERDSYDDSFEVSGEGTIRIDGSTSEASISGNAPRMKIIDIDFENVEITFMLSVFQKIKKDLTKDLLRSKEQTLYGSRVFC
jgi:hypothetical protein